MQNIYRVFKVATLFW